ncbi:hypothetical protein B5G52_14055 [Pseudoalteromonas sp. A601]|uniref:glycosyltransferase family 4 protein n=1 Tax=Pseudoalteromonas sp. A601 TaxID=1967839 RepID=UPI000B3CEE34|nr:glycosyltransferase family 4 protein [Pseudoalteromonas sp. A601]OUS70477.1 hypothetical protein B5G52_14055 [Pseudoalteromonas sp. A601]
MKKILIFSDEYLGKGGGAGVVADQLFNDFKRQGDECYLLTYKSIPSWVPSFFWIIYYPVLLVIQYFRTRYDLIVCNDPKAIYTLGLLNRLGFKFNYKCIMHGSEYRIFSECISFVNRIVLFKYFFQISINKAMEVIFVSKCVKKQSQNSFDITNKNLKVVYAGVELAIFTPPEKINTPESKNKIILTVARVIKGKGHFEFLEEFKKVLSNDSSFRWHVVGDGMDLDLLKSAVQTAGLEEFVIFHGKVNRVDIIKLYRNSYVFVLLTKLKEAFGLVFIEANSQGCAVIGPNKHGVKEAIENGVNGYLVDNLNCVSGLILDKSKISSITPEACIKHSQKFCSSKFALEVKEL